MLHHRRCVWIATLAVALAASARAQAPVFQLGQFDRMAREFHGREAAAPVDINVGQTDAAEKWPAVQAGSRNAKMLQQARTRTLRFTMNDAPVGVYTLDVAVMLGNPRIPRLDVELNGTPASIYFTRELTYIAEGRADSPVNGEARAKIAVPATALRKGANVLKLTLVDDDVDENGDSSLAWDALALYQGGDVQPALSVEPTFFYTRAGEALKERVDVSVSIVTAVKRGAVELTVNGAKYNAPLVAGRIGQQRFHFDVAEFAASTKAQLSVTLDGRPVTREFTLTPKRKFTVMIVPHNHLDIGYTDYQPKIEELQNRNLDQLLDEMRSDADLRFSLDGVWLVEQFLRTRSQASKREFFDLVRNGRISIPAQYANLMLGGASLETTLRSFYAGAEMNTLAGAKADYANITDVPAYPWAYASTLAAAGVKYFAAGANDDRGPQPLQGRWQTRSPFWWQGPDGAKVLMAYTRQYSQLWFVCGLPAREAGCRDSLPTLFQTFDRADYAPDTLLMFGSQLENTDVIPGEGEFVREWNARYAWPKLQLATFRDYFQTIEARFGKQLETVRGDFGPYWEDGIGTDARHAAVYRATENRVLAVEKLASVTTALSNAWAAPTDHLNRIWQDLLLYAEHTYTSHAGWWQHDNEQSVRQIETKHFHVEDARESAHWVAQESMSRLLDKVKIGAPAVVVFNSLTQTRDELVEFDLQDGRALREGSSVVPVEVLRRGSGYARVRFLAHAVPALGYKVYTLGEGAKPGAADAGQAATTMENAYYRVTVDPLRGAVSSLFDKQLNREMVDAKSPYLLNQYVYVAGGEGTRLIHSNDGLPTARLDVRAAVAQVQPRVTKTAWGQAMRFSLKGDHAARIDVELRLRDDRKALEIVNTLDKTPSTEKEAIYFAYPFAAAPEFEYEGQLGTVNMQRDQLAGANHEWFTVGHWAKVGDAQAAGAVIPLDAPLMSFGDINRGLWPTKFTPATSTLFAYPLNNYWHTNFPRVQEGRYTFRYVVTTGAQLNAATLATLSRASLTPLEIGELAPNDKVDATRGVLPSTQASFLEVTGAELEALAPAEDGHGYIARLVETSGAPAKVRIAPALLTVRSAQRTNAVQSGATNIAVKDGAVELDLTPYSVVTVRLQLEPGRALK